jgi:archaeal flagellin FlaB
MPTTIHSLKQEKGITGLETAIILIAFVIVASVLSYVVISAGLFSSQKAKTAVNSSLAQAGATIELKGNVVASMAVVTAGVTPYVEDISFTVGIVPGGSAIDFTDNPAGAAAAGSNSLIISYQDSNTQIPNMYFTVDIINDDPATADAMLDPGELAIVTVSMDPTLYTTAPYVMDAAGLTAGKTFTLSMTPPDGSILPIERMMPKRTSGLVNLY